MKKSIARIAACLTCAASLMGTHAAAAADSPADILALINDADNSIKTGSDWLKQAEWHWKLGNPSETCDALGQAHLRFTQAYRDEQQVKSDLEDGQIPSSSDAQQVSGWVNEFESTIPPVSEKMRQMGADSNC